MRNAATWKICLVLFAALLLVSALSLVTGVVRVPFDQLLESDVIRMRLMRILLGIVAGAGLSVAGVIFQALLRNPLAEPYVLGVSSGAGLAAAVAIVLGLSILGVWTVPAAAFLGALATIMMVYAIARRPGGVVPVQTLLLSGVVVGAVMGSILMFLVSSSETVGLEDTFHPQSDSATSDPNAPQSTAPSGQRLHKVIWWLLGNLQTSNTGLLGAVAVLVVTGLVASVLLARDLNLMTLGEEPAAHLGIEVERSKKLFFLLGSLMAGATVAACGLIGFVGLIVPHGVRMAVGPDHRKLVPASALAGAAFMVAADIVARTILSPEEIPIGVVTAFLGGPFFLCLLRRRRGGYWS